MATSDLVAVVFTDLVDSTGLAEALGAGADDQRRAHFDSLRGAVAATGGQEVKTIGDALMVTYPTATDAINGAVALQQAVDRDNTEATGPRLSMRVGISAGDATFEDGDWFGRPVVEASRLCALADGGQILAADIVRTLAGSRSDHSLVGRGEVELKGLPEPVSMCEVEWSPAATDGRRAQPPLPPVMARVTAGGFGFVGRNQERDRLTEAWKEMAGQGGRRLVLITGEPGIGKTRLVGELALLAHAEGGAVLWGGCDEDLGVPYEPFAHAIGHLAHALGPEALRSVLGPLGGDLRRLVVELDELVPGLDPAFEGEPDIERHRLYEAVSDLLSAVSDDHPVLLVLDDLHWAAKPTLLMLRLLLRAPRPAHILVVGTYRDTDLSRRHPLAEMLADLRSSGDVERVALSGLDADEVEALMAVAAGHDIEGAGLALAEAVFRETEGNPFFVREVLLNLVESGTLVQRDGRWASDVQPAQIGIPEGIREVIGRRLSRLPDATNELLAAASVLGREFDVGLLAAVRGEERVAVLDDLQPAEQASLVQATAGAAGTYQFAHALVRSVLYEELPTNLRLRLHREAGQALERRGDAEGGLADLARHFGEAATLGESARAVDYGRRAGERAMTDLAWEEAVSHFQRALGALDVADRNDPDTRCDLLLALGTAQVRAADPGSRATLFRAADLAHDLDDVDRRADATFTMGYGSGARTEVGEVDEERLTLLRACLEDIGEEDSIRRALLLSELVMERVWERDPEVVAWSDEALAIARRLGDRATLCEVLARRFSGRNLSDREGSNRWRHEIDELIAIADGTDDPLACSGRIQRAPFRIGSGDREGGDADLRAARSLAEHLREPALFHRLATIGVAVTLLSGRLLEVEELILANMAYAEAHDLEWLTSTGSHYFRLRYEQGRLEELLPLLEERLASTAAATQPAWTLGLANAYAQTGRNEDARPLIRALAADHFAGATNAIGNDWLIAGTARVASLIGDLEVAAEGYELALPFAGRVAWTGTSFEQPIDLSLGAAAGALGRVGEAEAHFRAAIDLSERAGAPTFVAASRLHWAEVLAATGQSDDEARARDLAAAALATARELGLGRIEQQAGGLVD